MTRGILILLPFVLLAACSVTDRTPIVHMQGVSASQYYADMAECRGYADQVDVERELALGAVLGAVGLAAFGAFLGDSDIIEQAVSIGVVVGATEGAGKAIGERNKVLGNCMNAKGYTVLN